MQADEVESDGDSSSSSELPRWPSSRDGVRVRGARRRFLRACVTRNFSPKRAVAVLTFVMFLNYVDRGIISGAATSIKGCVASRDLCGSEHPLVTCPSEVDFGAGTGTGTGVGIGNGTGTGTGTGAGTGARAGVAEPGQVCDQCKVCGEVCKGEVIVQTGFGIRTRELGLLQSVFMIGYVIGAVIFAQLANKVAPFKLISIGLGLWIAASLGSGGAGLLCKPSADGGKVCWSFYLMVLARALSGVGEASLNTLTLPFLDDILEPETKGFYIGLYYTSIPVGTAVGFMWAGIVSQLTHGQWEYAFILEAPLMLPFAVLAFFVPYSFVLPRRSSDMGHTSGSGEGASASAIDVDVDVHADVHADVNSGRHSGRRGVQEPLLLGASHAASRDGPSASVVRRMTIAENVAACLSRPAFVLGALGYAVYTGVVAGLGFYGPTFLQDYRPCDPRWGVTQTSADVIFGLIISTSGLFGTVLGGYLVDRIEANERGQKDRGKLLRQLLLQLLGGFAFSAVALVMLRPAYFFLFLFLGSCCIFMVSPGINMMLLWTVQPEHRPMAGALSVLAIHMFGDVPSPIAIGWVSDSHSPLYTLSATVAAMLVAVGFWAAILALPRSDQEEQGEQETASVSHTDDTPTP